MGRWIKRSRLLVAALTFTPRPIWPVAALLGEGPAWFSEEAALRFVDIKQGFLHRYHPATGATETVVLGGQPSFVLPANCGGLVVGSNAQLIRLNAKGKDATPLAQIPMPTHNRTNDATVDCHGQIWLGTMDDEERRPTGSLWCYNAAGLQHLGTEAVVTNGPAISLDGRSLFHVDSVARTIWRIELGAGPSIERRDLFLQLNESDGYPDGIVLDSEGCLWVALWDGWAVRRYSPKGILLDHINFPCARVTKIAFGGPDLRTVYATTARVGLSADALKAQPLAGALFAFEVAVPGNPLPPAVLP